MALRVSYSKPFSKKEDAQLWSDFKSGDKDAFTRIYYKNAKPLLDYSLKLTADKKLIEDCMQELFLDLWHKRTNLNEVQNIKNYLFTALRRRIMRSLRQQKIFFNSDAIQRAPGFELSLEGTMILEEEDLEKREKLHQLIKKLSNTQKEIIYLKYFSDFSFEEIADILKINKKAVYNSLSKAMIKLRAALISVIMLALFI